MVNNWNEIVKTTTPLSDFKEEMDTLLKIRSYRMFEDNESKELIEKTLEALQWKLKREMKWTIEVWENDKKKLGES